MRFKDTIGISHTIRVLDLELESKINEQLRSLGISHAQYSALSVLEQYPGMTNAQLARACFVTPQTMNRMIAALRTEGFIELKGEQKTPSRLLLHPTLKSARLVCKAHVLVNGVESKAIQGLSAKAVVQLKGTLQGLLNKLKGE